MPRKAHRGVPLTNAVDKGIGIYFTTYERMNNTGFRFLISNWAGIPYGEIRATGVGATGPDPMTDLD